MRARRSKLPGSLGLAPLLACVCAASVETFAYPLII